jgi:DNA-binding CsgD family transcriptional regulator
MVDGARKGTSAALVIRGEPGIGKSELLNAAGSLANDFLVARVTGVESEMELPYAGLQQLCRPFLHGVARLPPPLRDALDTAFGLGSGPPPDRFRVGLAVLQLLAEAADQQPVLCVADDAQWLDSASVQTLAFVARRMLAERTALLIATRDVLMPADLVDLPQLRLRGLSDTDAAVLLGSVLAGPTDRSVVERLLAESRGNPLALLELPRTWTDAERVEGLADIPADAWVQLVEERFLQRLRALPAEACLLLTLAAAEPRGDPTLLWSAAEHLGIGWEAASAAESSGLIAFGTRVRFRHALVRATAYRAASTRERLDVHAALAEVTDPVADPDRRAWHRANATLTQNDEIASELDNAADRARSRGGPLAAAALLERAALLTSDAVARADRTLAAAAFKREAGALDDALAMLPAVEVEATSPLRVAQADRLRGQIAFDQRRGADAAQLLLSAARQLESLDSSAARETYLEALAAAIWASGADEQGELRDAASAATAATPTNSGPGALDLVLDALAARIVDGFAVAAPKLRSALDAIASVDDDLAGVDRIVWLAGNRAAGIISTEVWDYEAGRALAERQVRVARSAGSLVQLQFALNFLANHLVLAGDLAGAAALLDEDRLISRLTGAPAVGYTSLMLAAFTGDEERTASLIATTTATAAADGQGRIVAFADYAAAVLHNGLGRHERALDCARRLFAGEVLGYQTLALSEFAEAASRTGDTAALAQARQWVSARVRETPTEWAQGIDARVRALASNGRTAERHHRASIAHLHATELRVEVARAHLLFGEWLRREGRRGEARDELRVAYDMFKQMTLAAFAERARRELLATGERVRRSSSPGPGALTAQEAQITRLVRQGLSNPEIATRLFLSARTVEWHLRNVFGKVGVSSRRQLRDIDLGTFATEPHWEHFDDG